MLHTAASIPHSLLRLVYLGPGRNLRKICTSGWVFPSRIPQQISAELQIFWDLLISSSHLIKEKLEILHILVSFVGTTLGSRLECLRLENSKIGRCDNPDS